MTENSTEKPSQAPLPLWARVRPQRRRAPRKLSWPKGAAQNLPLDLLTPELTLSRVWVKLSHQGTTGFSPWFHLPGFHFGHQFLTHTQVVSPWSTFRCSKRGYHLLGPQKRGNWQTEVRKLRKSQRNGPPPRLSLCVCVCVRVCYFSVHFFFAKCSSKTGLRLEQPGPRHLFVRVFVCSCVSLFLFVLVCLFVCLFVLFCLFVCFVLFVC